MLAPVVIASYYFIKKIGLPIIICRYLVLATFMMFVSLQQSLLLLYVCIAVVSGPFVISVCTGKDIVLYCSKEIVGDKKPYWIKDNSDYILDTEDDDKYMTGSNPTDHKLHILNVSIDDIGEYKCQANEGYKHFITTLTTKHTDECKSAFNFEEMSRDLLIKINAKLAINFEEISKEWLTRFNVLLAILVILVLSAIVGLFWCYHLCNKFKSLTNKLLMNRSRQIKETDLSLATPLIESHSIPDDAGSSTQVADDGLSDNDCNSPTPLVELPKNEDVNVRELGVVSLRKVPENNLGENEEFKIEIHRQ